jgi:adenylosuccinate lyase
MRRQLDSALRPGSPRRGATYNRAILTAAKSPALTAPTALTALSPLDGRYAARVAALRPLMSEYGLMHRRVQVEVEWFIALSDAGFAEFKPLTEAARGLMRSLVLRFSEADAAAIKEIERTTNHDVKAVEYWIKDRIAHHGAGHAELARAAEFVHFACTSEDINNASHALMLEAARRTVLLPALDAVIEALRALARAEAATPMLARTHGQAASPTTVGKEAANVLSRLVTARARIAAVPLPAKMNGAVGSYNAHVAAFPDFDWERFARMVVEQRLGLAFNALTTQIEPHDGIAELFDAVARGNTVCIDWCRDVWGYVALGYFKQRAKAGEVGSSTMPHKVNPIDFENAEGNYGLANALLSHMSGKLPLSRWQRDLTDSTVLRNMGVALGYTVLAHGSLCAGMGKLEVHRETLAADLDAAPEVLAEAVQTVMRRHGLADPYERLKAFTRGRAVTLEAMHAFVDTLSELPAAERARLKAMTPAGYTGLAAALARKV